MKKELLLIVAIMLFAAVSNATPAFFNKLVVTKGDYSFMKENAKVWLNIDFTKAQLVDFDVEATKVKEEKGLYLEQKPADEWVKDYNDIYPWIIKVWNKACDKRGTPLYMTSDRSEAKYAMEINVDRFDYGWPMPPVMNPVIKGEGATIDGTIVVRDLQSGETVFEAKVDRIQTWFGAPSEVMRIRAVLFGNILAPYFLGMSPNAWDATNGAGRTRYKSNWDDDERAEKEVFIN